MIFLSLALAFHLFHEQKINLVLTHYTTYGL